MKPLTLFLCLALSACATCHRHPTGCAIVATVIAGAAIVAVGAAQANKCSVIGAGTTAPACAR